MKKVLTFGLYLVFLIQAGASGIVVVPMPPGNYQPVTFSTDQLLMLEQISAQFTGLPVIECVNSKKQMMVLSTSLNYPPGSWGRGYETWPGVNFYTESDYGYYYASHPLIRDVSCFMRGHLHLYKSDSLYEKSLTLVRHGIDYLLSEQIVKGRDKGAYTWWLKRAGKNNLRTNPPVNKPHVFETAHALTALAEYHQAKIPYRREDVLQAIELASANLVQTDWNGANVANSNMRALGVWALAAAYKVTADSTTLQKVKDLTEWILRDQETGDSLQKGMWLTGGEENVDGYILYHDTKIFYHLMILRGLIGVFEITENSDTNFKQRVLDAIKLAVNHLILHRINASVTEDFRLRYSFGTSDHQATPEWYVHEASSSDITIETLVKLVSISKQAFYFNDAEQESIRQLALKISGCLDYREKWYMCGTGYYVYYMNR